MNKQLEIPFEDTLAWTKQVQIGDRVKALQDWSDLAQFWNAWYPEKGEVLHVVGVKLYDGVAGLKTLMLLFEGHEDAHWVCYRDSEEDYNFEKL